MPKMIAIHVHDLHFAARYLQNALDKADEDDEEFRATIAFAMHAVSLHYLVSNGASVEAINELAKEALANLDTGEVSVVDKSGTVTKYKKEDLS